MCTVLVCSPYKPLKQCGLRPLGSQQVARRLGGRYVVIASLCSIGS